MRILILGASGLAGAEIRRTLDTPGNLVYGSCRNPAGAAGLCRYDLDGPGDLEAVLEETRPEAIVSCLRGDYEKQLEAHRTAGDYLAGRGGRRVYLSTANVFDGPTMRTIRPGRRAITGASRLPASACWQRDWGRIWRFSACRRSGAGVRRACGR